MSLWGKQIVNPKIDVGKQETDDEVKECKGADDKAPLARENIQVEVVISSSYASPDAH
jgi:hypothetical protein